MAGENDAVTLLSYKVNSGSVAAAVAANQKVGASLKAVNTEAMSLADRIRAGGVGLGLSPQELQQAAQYLGVQTGAISAQTQEMQRQLPIAERLAAAAQVRASAETGAVAGLRAQAVGGSGASGGSTRSVKGALTGVREGLIALPNVGYQNPAVVALRGLIPLAEKTGASFTQLGAALGIAGVAVVAVAVALDQMNKQIEVSKKVLTGALSAQDAFYKALESSTSEQVAAQLDELKRRREILALQRAETQGALDSAFAQAQAQFGDAAARGLDAAGQLPTAQLREQLKGLDEQYQAADQSIVRLTQGLDGNLYAVNDLEAAYNALTEEQLDAADQALEIDRLTKEQREERIAQNNRDVNVLTRLVGAGGLTSEALLEYAARITELNADTEALTGISSTYADQLEREKNAKEALTERNDQLLDLIDEEVSLREEAFEIQQKILDIETERDARIREIEADRDERLLELTGDAEERRIEIIEDANERIAKIERDARRDIFNAVANRDAVALKQAEIRRADALEDQQKGLDKSYKQVEKNLEKQEKALDKSYRKQVDNVQDSTNKQLNIQRRALYETEFAIASSVLAQRMHVENGFALMASGSAIGMELLRNVVVTGIYNMAQQAASIFGSVFGGSSQFPTLTSTYPQAGMTSSQFNQQFDRRFNQTVNFWTQGR